MVGSRRLPWVLVAVLVAVLLMVVTALVLVLMMRDDGDPEGADPAASPPGSPSASPTTSTATEQTGTDDTTDETDDAEPPADPPADPLPLRDPGEHLPADGASDLPALGADLVNGDYVAHVTGADPTTMLLEADVEAFYVGDAADEYLLEHDPTAEIPPPNGFVLVNESTNVRQVPMAADIRVWDWCFGGDGQLAYAERSLEEWRLAPAGGSQECSAGADLGHGGALYWLQVRDGEVQRVIGQYLP